MASQTLLHGTKIQISREGVQTVWAQYYVQDYKEVSGVPTDFGSTMGGGKLRLVEISASQAEEGEQYVVTAKYEGIAEESLRNPQYDWSPTETQEPLRTNPNWEQIKTQYGGQYDAETGTVTFPEEVKAGKGGKTAKNPLVGVEYYYDVGGTWSETTAHEEIPEDAFAGLWSIVDQVPGNFPTPPGRAWLVMPPIIAQRGACFVVQKNWKMTGVMTKEALDAARLIYTPIK